MSIVSSVILSDQAQVDRRRAIVEEHTDHVGQKYRFAFIAPQNYVPEPVMAARAIQLAADLKANEIAQNIANVAALNSSAVVVNVHSSSDENDLAVRQAYLPARNSRAAAMGSYLGTLTNPRLQTAFGLSNNGQVVSLRNTQLTPHGNLMSQLHSAAGA